MDEERGTETEKYRQRLGVGEIKTLRDIPRDKPSLDSPRPSRRQVWALHQAPSRRMDLVRQGWVGGWAAFLKCSKY